MVCVLADACMQWNVSQQTHTVPRALLCHSIRTKNVGAFMAVWAGEDRHILNHAKYLEI